MVKDIKIITHLILTSIYNNSDNDIIVALLDDSVTVKRFFKEEDHIRLQPENDTMEPIIVPQDAPFSIVGKVIGLYRAFK